jgi:hypothetical protein
MYTMVRWEDKDVQANGKETQNDLDTLLDEQEWLNFKLGLFAEY